MHLIFIFVLNTFQSQQTDSNLNPFLILLRLRSSASDMSCSTTSTSSTSCCCWLTCLLYLDSCLNMSLIPGYSTSWYHSGDNNNSTWLIIVRQDTDWFIVVRPSDVLRNHSLDRKLFRMMDRIRIQTWDVNDFNLVSKVILVLSLRQGVGDYDLLKVGKLFQDVLGTAGEYSMSCKHIDFAKNKDRESRIKWL